MPERVCGVCGAIVGYDSKRRSDRHDACIAGLPGGVVFACCGHGELIEDEETGARITTCYLAFDDGLVLYGNVATTAMEMLGGAPPPIPEGAQGPSRKIFARYV